MQCGCNGRTMRVNSPVAGVPELRPGTLSAELGPEDGAFTPPSGGGAPAPLHPQGQTPPQGAGLLPGVNYYRQQVNQ